MIRFRGGVVVLAAWLIMAVPSHSTTLGFSGSLAQDDAVATFGFSLTAAGAVTLRSLSYAGGTNGAGLPVAAGGFDPVVSLFSAGGALLATQDDATPECNGVPNDPVTNDCFDVNLLANLAAGDYLVAVTQFDNRPLGPDFAAGFSRSGASFTAEFGCLAGRFCDVSADSRTAFWAVDVTGDSVAAVVPLPAAGGLLGFALAATGLWRRRRV